MRGARKQRGIALLALVAALVLGASWLFVSHLNAGAAGVEALRKQRSTEALMRARTALIGYMAAQATKRYEPRPGALPCPEAPGYYDNPSQEGQAAGGCTLPAVGRFPWRTLGTEKLVDGRGEPLWYAVGPGWAYNGANPIINSDSVGALTVDGVPNDAVALIIAPGPAIRVQASGCENWEQTRPTTGNPDVRNYLECENATSPPDSAFISSGPAGSFNDQVIKVTAADLLPALEAAVAYRFEQEVAPVLRTVYSGAEWGSTGLVRLPMAIAFANPNAATPGGAPAMQGLPPFLRAETSPGSGTACAPSASPGDWCAPGFVKWSGTPALTLSAPLVPTVNTCSIVAGVTTAVQCTYRGSAPAGTGADSGFTLTATADNVGAALRQFNTAVAMNGVRDIGRSASGVLQASGAATITLNGTAIVSQVADALCGIVPPLDITEDCYQYDISVPILLLSDHAAFFNQFLHSTNAYDTWFFRNRWHLVSYYAVASAVGPGGTGSCVTGSTCLRTLQHAADGRHRALLILAGRPLPALGQDRGASSALSNWFEGANGDGASPFEARSLTLVANRTFNDRIAAVDSNPSP
jgi:hypothetical protein